MFEHLNASASEILGLIFFVFALLHTFAASRLKSLSHVLSETELAFPIWGLLYYTALALLSALGWINTMDPRNDVRVLWHHLDLSEPLFVFTILLFTNTPLVIRWAEWGIEKVASLIKWLTRLTMVESFYIAVMVIGPLLGSLITEPAAMTVSALLLRDRYYLKRVSQRFKFISFANLLVNVSIGGVLTNFAAPPILMVRNAWGWSSQFMFANFGLQAASAVLINALICWWCLRFELRDLGEENVTTLKSDSTGAMVMSASAKSVLKSVLKSGVNSSAESAPESAVNGHLDSFGGRVKKVASRTLQGFEWKLSFYVALFLTGVMVLGHQQTWWLRGLINDRAPLQLFLGATGLTSITDNAALTYLSSQILSLTPEMRHAIVAGSVAGGGLTIVANAPNPIGFVILREEFGENGLGVWRLLRYACLPTVVAMLTLWLF